MGTGTVIAWGWNAYGQTNVPVGLTGVQAIEAGYNHTVALKSDGTVVAWGLNDYGQTNVPLGLTDVQAIAPDCLRHRVTLSYTASADGVTKVLADRRGDLITLMKSGDRITIAR